MSIVIRDVSKNFGDFKVLQEINLEIKEGSLVALLGPSGSGKSTLLRAIAGLQPPDTGKIIIYGEDMTYLDVKKRNIGFVFQHYALFKEMTVRDNIAFGLDIRKAPRSQIKQRVDELLALIKLEGLGDRYPDQLSGGQRQRIAIARAILYDAPVLLLDEATSSLDPISEKLIKDALNSLMKNRTSIIIAHRLSTIIHCDKIIVISNGRVVEEGSHKELLEKNGAYSNLYLKQFEINQDV